jgi:2'-5' RNA ligase
MNDARGLRLFFALWPDDSTRAALAALQLGLRGRPTAPENLHLTMAFLGQQPAALLPALQAILGAMAPRDITLKIDRLGYFARSRVAWAGLEDAAPALREWQAELTGRLLAQGIGQARDYGFTPHVTLMRHAEKPGPGPDAQPIAEILWPRPQLVLVSSETRPEGPRYQLIGAAASTVAASIAGAG